MVEQPIRNRQVAGSSPALGSHLCVGSLTHRINPQFTEPFGDGASSVQVPSFSPSASIALTCDSLTLLM